MDQTQIASVYERPKLKNKTGVFKDRTHAGKILGENQIQEGIRKTQSKVERRSKTFRVERPFPDVKGRPVILVDDGLASGFTMRTSIEALRNGGADNIIVAVPTAHDQAVADMASLAEVVFCANIRRGGRFAVAEAYQHWYDVSEEEVMEMMKGSGTG